MALEFKEKYKSHNIINVKAKNGKFYPMRRELILQQAQAGYIDDKRLGSIFTRESVKAFIAERDKKEKASSRKAKKEEQPKAEK